MLQKAHSKTYQGLKNNLVASISKGTVNVKSNNCQIFIFELFYIVSFNNVYLTHTNRKRTFVANIGH